MDRTRWVTQFASALLALALMPRCMCDDPNLSQIPKPDIEVVDVTTGTTNQAVPFIIDFGAVDIGGQLERTVRVRNAGNGQLQVSSLRLLDSDLDETVCPGLHRAFGFVSQAERATPFKLEPRQERDVRISFTPSGAGPHCMGLSLESNDEDEPQVLVYLVALGSGGRLCTVPYDAQVLDFGPVFIGELSRTALHFENCGNRPIQVSGIALVENPDEVFGTGSLPSLPLPLQPGEGFDAEFTFQPLYVRYYSGAMQGLVKLIVAEPYASEQYVVLEGVGAERPRCKLAVVPATLQFGAVAANTSPTRNLILRNNGECDCEVSAISPVVMDEQAATDPGSFSIPAPPALPLYLAGSAPTSDGCTASPQTPAGNSATLTVQYNAPDRQDVVVERGHFDISSNDLVNDPQRVNLEASGGGSPRCQFKVTPEAPDEPSATSFDWNCKTLTERWGLVKFGNVNVHYEHLQPILFENIGNIDCAISQVKWRQSWTPQNEFGFADESQQPLSLPATVNRTVRPGEVATYYATFKPTHTISNALPIPNMKCLSGGYCGALTSSYMSEICLQTPCIWGNGVDFVTSDTVTDQSVTGQYAVQGTFSIGFMGKPTTPAIDVIPSSVDWGLITVGCGAEERTIKIYNTGNGVLRVTRLEITPDTNPDEFRVTAAVVPQDVQPGGQPMLINLRFYARHEGMHRADLIIYGQEGSSEVPMFTVPLQGVGTFETHHTDVFRQLTDPLVDVLWVVDDSGSMGGEQDMLADNFPTFFSQTTINNVDYHIAVTTTLTREGCVPDFTNPQDSCAGQPPHDKAGLYTSCSGNDKWITLTSANPQQQFNCNVQVSDSGHVNPDRPSSDEAEGGLLASKLFLSPPKITDPAANGGFLREDAKLYVIVVSDEEDQSDGPTDLYVDFYRNLKGFRNQGMVNFSAVAGPAGGCNSGSTNDGLGADDGARYRDVASAMGGLFQSICETDWTGLMNNLAIDSFGLKIQFFLSRAAASAGAIEVCVSPPDQDLTGYTGPCSGRGGTVVPLTSEGAANGWWYDGASNSIVFNAGSVPQRGQWIRADYDTACLPTQP
ncbi:MAG: choice-of-anchor D domain-containing protein [Deltaproteobacteria bacterium]|nr:choice-of-anchor D domain-containing protein [Deltaproteobacteria bacterium]